ncbi:MAG: hypothetical protein PHX44_10045 [Sulfurimonas sp.]|uniref:hypothetical protein n=1 Tax=Sulfurimonas sp. TaxID=2022749 RepID=UPI0026348B76|nr:hypothetical protein [Sulfurimonas sp.]MDD2653374.1 hypothetical protein [Sulfurimonas sp.]MDD3450680.1 hypothetical protein [Sulfurimonas sp.]
MKPLEKFKAQSPPKRRVSRLKKFETEIFELYADGYQVEQIQEFLAANGVKISVRAINKFKQNLSIKSNSSLKTSGGTAAPAKNTKKTVEELKNSPDTNIATKLFLQNL